MIPTRAPRPMLYAGITRHSQAAGVTLISLDVQALNGDGRNDTVLVDWGKGGSPKRVKAPAVIRRLFWGAVPTITVTGTAGKHTVRAVRPSTRTARRRWVTRSR